VLDWAGFGLGEKEESFLGSQIRALAAQPTPALDLGTDTSRCKSTVEISVQVSVPVCKSRSKGHGKCSSANGRGWVRRAEWC
jgi:hypothetical protein